jgi:hypothetical protein
VLTSLISPQVLADVEAGNTVERTEALGQALDEEVLIKIANLRSIQEASNLSVEELYALYHGIPQLPTAPGKASLFARLLARSKPSAFSIRR